MAKVGTNEFKAIKIGLIDRPRDVTRMEIGEVEIQELAQSISEQGLLQPIVVNKDGDRFEIIAGDRRYLAVKSLGQKTILSKIVEMNAEEIGLARAVENLQRKDLSPIEEGVIYTNLTLAHGMTIDEIAKRMGKSPGVVRRREDLLAMPDYLQKAIHEKKISVSVAEELMSCTEAGHRQYLCEMAVDHGVTREVARMWVNDWKKELRKPNVAGDEGGGPRTIMEPEIIYRPCDMCKSPVNIQEMEELRMCPACHKAILTVIQKA